ncbi:RHS repeat-associated core domain-containing protein [Pseudomonas hefeiensis]|uniref:RHS repeat-associated core domain-containing protein n=1 Tax=Pseudomonas hefeiensis TaxID=2738125 RepID=UPI0027341150|nr:RHS repeat-associated core domain-containing protein [Pseudomonas sp. FP821]WLI41174.1 RHS repeat-associated core domain-containing protein [Pseudomonas sp. FP821]
MPPNPTRPTSITLAGHALRSDSVDAGWRLELPGLAGETRQRWDQRANHWRIAYDLQLRPIALEENGQAEVDTFTYADATADADHNLRGQLFEQSDPSGTVHLDSYGLSGEPLRQVRRFTDAIPHICEQTLDALGTPVSQTDAAGHRRYLRLDIGGQLKQVDLQLKDQDTPQPILLDARYNAAGQIERQETANGVTSRWTYDPATDQLSTLKAGKSGQALLQNLAYLHDPMGNVLRIEDLTVAPLFFANQRIEGHRDFTYDSLYRLLSASGFEGAIPHLHPGLPEPVVPIDPGHRFNYTQLYDYDAGNNLTRLRHVRDGNNHTRTLRIDPHSNRGVQWTEGEPEPAFDALFDAHGNQLYLQRGAQSLVWDARDQLSKVTLLKRDNGLPDDDETCLYSQGERVSKTHTTASTRHETRYLPGLEIRTSSHGEQLHVVTCALAHGSVRCLHWEAGQPSAIEADQLRYNLDDHLGSSSLELDRHGALISLEHYYPFGGTAWRAARSSLEVDYKTLRYSGKEMDTSGLYYYGARYYAPWLQRWVSADPAGDVDGLNLYGFVGNNPMTFTDDQGLIVETAAQRDARKAQSAAYWQQRSKRNRLNKEIRKFTDIMKLTSRRASEAQTQLASHRSTTAHIHSAAVRVAAHVGAQAISYGTGVAVGIATAAMGSVAGPPGMVLGAALGFATSKAVSIGLDYALERLSLSAAVNFKSRKLDPEKIVRKGEYKNMDFSHYAKAKARDLAHAVSAPSQKNVLKAGKEVTSTGTKIALKATGTVAASEVGAVVGAVLGTIEIIHEIGAASHELTEEKIARADTHINGMIEVLNAQMAHIDTLFAEAQLDAVNTYRPLSKIFGQSSGDTPQSLRREMEATIGRLRKTQSMLR